MYVGLSVGVRMCFREPVEDRGIGSPGDGVMGSCGSSSRGAGNWAPILCRSSTPEPSLQPWIFSTIGNLNTWGRATEMREADRSVGGETQSSTTGLPDRRSCTGPLVRSRQSVHVPLRTWHGVSLSTGMRRRLQTGHPLDVCSPSLSHLCVAAPLFWLFGPQACNSLCTLNTTGGPLANPIDLVLKPSS